MQSPTRNVRNQMLSKCFVGNKLMSADEKSVAADPRPVCQCKFCIFFYYTTELIISNRKSKRKISISCCPFHAPLPGAHRCLGACYLFSSASRTPSWLVSARLDAISSRMLTPRDIRCFSTRSDSISLTFLGSLIR